MVTQRENINVVIYSMKTIQFTGSRRCSCCDLLTYINVSFWHYWFEDHFKAINFSGFFKIDLTQSILNCSHRTRTVPYGTSVNWHYNMTTSNNFLAILILMSIIFLYDLYLLALSVYSVC